MRNAFRYLACRACRTCNLPQKNPTGSRRLLSTSAVNNEIFKSTRPAQEIPSISLSDYMFSRFQKFGNTVALIDDSNGTTYRYSQLEELSKRVGSYLYRNGFRKNDVLCYYGTNNPEFALLFMGCASVGVTLTTANPAYTSGELERQMTHSGAKGIVTVPGLVSIVREAEINDIIVIGNAEGCRPFSELLSDDGSCFPTNLSIDPHEDVLAMPYSSGTTGLPKGVMLSHYNVVANLKQFETVANVTPDSNSLAVLPFFHIYGMIPILCGALQSGARLATVPGFDPEGYLKALERYKVTHLYVVPPILLFLTRHPLVDKIDLSNAHYVVCGAAPLGASLTAEFTEKRKLNVQQGYGMTEASPLVSYDFDEPTLGSVGGLVSNTEAKFIDPETGRSLGRNETGEMCARGPQNMKGYIANEAATREIIDEDGWLHTGDMGHMNDNDCIIISDRLKELIKYKGFQVAPAELEDMLFKHPAVQDVAVIGMPDDRAGELPRAYVVLKPDVTIHSHDIMSYVEKNAADYKQLRGGVEFVKEIPKSPSGKILRRLLRDQLASSQM